jgi:hypothetical protein
VEAGADFRSLNSYGCNAAQWAAQTDDLAMCAWLQSVGLDLTLLNHNGHSALPPPSPTTVRAAHSLADGGAFAQGCGEAGSRSPALSLSSRSLSPSHARTHQAHCTRRR